eukprot:8861413-Pyramimonas_sp.AAC.1
MIAFAVPAAILIAIVLFCSNSANQHNYWLETPRSPVSKEAQEASQRVPDPPKRAPRRPDDDHPIAPQEGLIWYRELKRWKGLD